MKDYGIPPEDPDDGETGPAAKDHIPAKRKPLSLMLAEIAEDPSRDRVSIGDLMTAMQGRAIAALLLIFAFPNILPTVPGASGILGLPLVYLTSQMMLGRMPWLPAFIANRSMARDDFAAMAGRIGPLLERAEKLLRPRLAQLVTPSSQRALGGLALVLAVAILLPIPFGNMLPAVAICMIALGVLEHDGVWIVAGIATGAIALGVVGIVVFALAKAAVFIVINAII